MQSKNTPSLRIKLYPSGYCMGILLLMHIGALVILLALPLQWWAQLAIAIILGASLTQAVRKHVAYRDAKAIRFFWTEDGKRWLLKQKDETVLTGEVMGDSVVTNYLVIINFKLMDKKHRSIVIFKDGILPSDFRRLKVLLRTKR